MNVAQIVSDREWTPYEVDQIASNGTCETCLLGPLQRHSIVRDGAESFTVTDGVRCLWCGADAPPTSASHRVISGDQQ